MAALVGLLAAPPVAAAATVGSGLYEQLQLARTPDGRLVGRYWEERGGEPHFSCEFFFAGQLSADGRAEGVTWADDAVHQGRVRATPGGVEITAPGSSGYPGCG